MGIYRKKPVEIEAYVWDGTAEGATPIIDWALAYDGTIRYHEYLPAEEFEREDGSAVGHPEEPEHLAIDTLEGTMSASPGDWIIKGVSNEFYPCKPDIFEKTYERAV
ncbi:MAG: hypothetical protein ACTHJ9_00650 [Rhodanobacter sp.]